MQLATAEGHAPPLALPLARCPAGLVTCLCRECLRPFAKVRVDQVFCVPPCRRVWHSRVESRAKQAYEAGMAMRRKKRGGFTTLTNLFDAWIREDRQRDEAYATACRDKGIGE